jgi:Sec-independent protein translocase protein TatA
MLPNLKFGELAVIAIVVIFIFGPRRIGALARSIGKSFFQYKRTVEEIKSDVRLGTSAVKNGVIEQKPSADPDTGSKMDANAK